MVTTKRLNIKNRTYYFHDDLINLKNFDPSLLKPDKKSSMDISIYYIEYITTKSISDYENITSVNPLYLIINDVDGHIESLLTHNQAYSGIFSALCNPCKLTTLPYSEPWHISNRSLI